MLLTHIQTRILQPGLAQLLDPAPPRPTRLRTAARAYQNALDHLAREAELAHDHEHDSINPTLSALVVRRF
jgi:hypothetical protein